MFLDVNEQGQFLWIEARNPELAVLDPFVELLASGDRRYRANRNRRPRVRYADYLASDAYRQFTELEYPELPEDQVSVSDRESKHDPRKAIS